MRKKSATEKKLAGNPGKRPIVDEFEVGEAIKPDDLTETEEYFWNKYAPVLKRCGKLMETNVDSFLRLIQNQARLKLIDDELKTLEDLIQENTFLTKGGAEVNTIKESVYSELSKDYTAKVVKLEKMWGLSGDSVLFKIKAPKKDKKEKMSEDEFLN